MENASTVPRRYLLTMGKALVSITLLGIIVARLDFSFFQTHWHKLNLGVVIACGGLLAVQVTVIAGTRLKLVLECLGSISPLARTSKVALCGFFFEQVAFGFVGGDAMRLWLLRRMDIPVRKAFQALFIDRCIGLVALLLLVLSGLPGLMHLLPNFDDPKKIVLACAAILLIASTIWSFWRVIPAKYRRHPVLSEIGTLISKALCDASVGRRLLLVLAFAVLVHLLNVLIMFLVGLTLGISVSLQQWFFIVPAALLFSMIPVSAGGWGLREGILVFGLQGLGVRPEEAVVPPLVFGLGLFIVTLPGGMIWLSNLRSKVFTTQARRTEATPGGNLPALIALGSLPIRSGDDR